MGIQEDELPKVLARALVRAWDMYEARGAAELTAETARPLLARHLVALAKEGMTSEEPLTAAGYRHLISLGSTAPFEKPSDIAESAWSRQRPPHLRIEHARAKFLLQWRIRGGQNSR